MLVLNTIKDIQNQVFEWKKQGFKIGFVPTMGSLHEGHLDLVKRSKESCDVTVVSIFVNATQFNDASDFEKYPRDLTNDSLLLDGLADVVFAPSHGEMYGGEKSAFLKFDFGSLESVMEGRFRAGHFNGVGTVVSKLFNIVQPDVAIFGQKDIQQFAIINQLVKDLSFPVTLVCHPIIRDEGGLALSSRNKRLSNEGLVKSRSLNKTLIEVKTKLIDQLSIVEAIKQGGLFLAKETAFKLDYLEVVDMITLQPKKDIKVGDTIAICIAAYIEDVRLIDNLIVTF